jgi:TatD DNase family protein
VEVPLEAIVLETDAPDMSPAAHHGERNSPEYLPEVLQALATLRGIGTEALAAQLLVNTLEIFGIKK